MWQWAAVAELGGAGRLGGREKSPKNFFFFFLDIVSNWVYTGGRKRRKEQVTAFKESKNRYYVL